MTIAASIDKYVLTNNLHVLIAHVPQTQRFEFSMHCHTGSRDETEKNSGISHFLEHMMFRGTKDYPDSVEFARQVESLGGDNNASTDEEWTSYWFTGRASLWEKGLDLFAGFWHTPVFSDLEIERQVVIQELANDYNEDGLLIDTDSLTMKSLFPEHPMGMPIIGLEKTIKNISIKDLQDHLGKYYLPENCVLTINSPIDPVIVLERIKKTFGIDWSFVSSKKPMNRKKVPDWTPGIRYALQPNPDNQYELHLSWPAFGHDQPEKMVHQTLLERILDDGISSRLFSVLREKNGLVYDVSAHAQGYSDVGIFSIQATIEREMFLKSLPVLKTELISILQQAPFEDELERVKSRYLFDLDTIPESSSEFLEHLAKDLMTPHPFSLEQERQILMQAKASDVLQVAQEILGHPSISCVLVGPDAPKQRSALERFLRDIPLQRT